MAATDDALAQLNTLLLECKKYGATAPIGDEIDPYILIYRLQAAVERFVLPSSVYATDLDRERRTRYASASGQLRGMALLATALRDDIEAGWIVSVVEMAHADTYEGYLDQAEGLVSEGFKDPAAVIASTSLEVHLKALATKHGISLVASNGGPKKMDAMNAELKAAGVYNALEHKQVTAWLAIRNSAAHGDYADYDEAVVKALVVGVRDFAAKYPA
jgi:hypothetical protein